MFDKGLSLLYKREVYMFGKGLSILIKGSIYV